MKTVVALLRGINVGGKNSLPMKELVDLLEGIGARGVKTYIQSGNAILQTSEKDLEKLSRKLTAAIKKHHGFEPHVQILPLDVIDQAIANNPFPEAESEPNQLHVGFMAEVPTKPNLEKLRSLKKENEDFRLIGSVFFLHAPDGVGNSKLAAGAEKLLAVPMTFRNWRTVGKIRELANE